MGRRGSMGGLIGRDARTVNQLLHGAEEFGGRIWRPRLSRPSQGKRMPWLGFLRLAKHYHLPHAQVVHGLSSSKAN
jgi:hypothetical protein